MDFFFTKSLVFIGLATLAPNFYVRVRPWAEPNLIFRFRFSAKSAEPGPNRTVASLLSNGSKRMSEPALGIF